MTPLKDITAAPARAAQAVTRGLRWFGGLFAAVFKRVFAHNVTGRASQFAYSAFVATVPFAFVLVATIGLIADRSFAADLIRDYGDEIPDQFENVLKEALETATGNTGAAVVALAVGLVAGLIVVSNVMVTLMGAFDNAYGVRHRPWLRGRMVGLGLSLATSVFAVVTTAGLVGGPELIDAIFELAGIESGTAVELARQTVFLLGMASLVFMTLILYRFGPNTKVHRFLEILPGAVIAVFAWIGTTRLFRVFVDNFGEYNNIYGGLASFVVYLWYLYMSGIVLLIGAELNGELAKRRAVRDALAARAQPEPDWTPPAEPFADSAGEQDTGPLTAPLSPPTQELPPPPGTTEVLRRP